MSEFPDFLIEAGSIEEKFAWLAALQAHSLYIEASFAEAADNNLEQEKSQQDEMELASPGRNFAANAATSNFICEDERSNSMVVDSSTGRSPSVDVRRGSVIPPPNNHKKWMVFLGTLNTKFNCNNTYFV